MSTDIVTLNGVQHWTTSNGIRTFIGPVRHIRTRSTMKARDIAASLRRAGKTPATPPLDPTDITVVLPRAEAGETPSVLQPLNDDTAVLPPLAEQAQADFERLSMPTITLPPMPKRPRNYQGRSRRTGTLARIREDITDALYDDAWQKMARNTALTIGSYVALVGGSMLLGKAVLWFLFL